MKRWTAIMMIGTMLVSSAGGLLAPQASAQAAQKELVEGWYQGLEVQYYDFGMNAMLTGDHTVGVQPIFVLIYGMNADGTPRMVEGQHNIVDVVPGEANYSDLWRVTFVTVPEDYEADSVRSVDDISAAGYDLTSTDMLVNCPIVPAGTTLEGGETLVQGWHDGEEVFYPDFGENPASTAPIWVLIHGMNADGTPNFVEGQQNIIDLVPGDAGYSDFWQVNLVTVPEDYVANTFKSAADVVASGYEVMETDMVVNCPVTFVAGAPVTSDLPSSGTGVGHGSGSFSAWAVAALAALGAAGVAAGSFALARRRA